tara:strand:+ start:204 stop:581 length:378 start_codon:yes stop_codon:yes gene_type:complete
MNLLKKIINLKFYKNYISLFAIFFLVNNLTAFGSENKSQSLLSKQRDIELEEIFKLNEIPYSEHDNLNNQLKIFFGLYSPKSDINNYPDLSIIDMSDALREGYRLKLKEMTINTTNNKIKKDAFF